MEEDLKRCPYCGEKIKIAAIKCKHCGEYLKNETPAKLNKTDNNGKITGIVSWIIFVSFIVLIIIGLNSENTYYGENTYSGFNSFATSNGAEIAKCSENAAGKSLVQELENKINESNENSNVNLYSISQYNPNLHFEVSNPSWAENPYNIYMCIADVKYKNYKSDTIAGYRNNNPFTMDEAYCYVYYTVSQRGDMFKAYIRETGCSSNEGYVK